MEKLKKKFNKKGLSLESRKTIQKVLGKEDSKTLYNEYSIFIKENTKPIILNEKLNINTIEKEKYITTNLFLKNNNQLVEVIAELNKISLQNILECLKRLAKIKKTNTTINYKTLKNTSKYQIECIDDKQIKLLAKKFDYNIELPQNSIVNNDKHFKIMDSTNSPIAIFSLQEDFQQVFLGNLIIKKNKRNTKSTLETILAIRDFLKIYTQKTITCAVEMSNTHLVKLYQKFGFKVETAYSISENNTNEITSAYILKLIQRKRH